MARDNDIQIVAGLDIPKSKSTIDKDIPTLEKELQNDKSSRPKLIATLDINKSKKAIQANLDTLISKTDAPKIKVGIDVGGADVKKIQKDISQQINKAIPTKIGSNLVDSFMSEFSIVGKKAKEIKGDVAGLLSEFNDGFNAKDSEKYYNSLKKIFDLIAQNTQTYSKPTKEIKKEIDNYMANALEGSPAFIDAKTKSELTTMLGKNGIQSVLSSIFGGGKWTFKRNKSGFVGVDTLINPDIVRQCNGVADALMHIYDAKMMLKRGIDDSPTNLFEANGIKSQQGALDYVEKRLYSILGLQHQIQTGMVELYSGDDDFVELIGMDDTLDNKSLASRRFSKMFDNNAERTLEQAKSEFRELYNIVDGENGRVSAKWIRDAADNINGLSVEVKKAEGEIETFKYKLSDDRTGFVYTGSSASDKGIIQQAKQIEKTYSEYTQKFAQFKSTNHELLSGLTQPLIEFETKLNGLKTGISTIEEVKSAYKSLQTASSNITQNFSRQLSPIDSAIRNISKGEETISGLKAEFKGLTNVPKEVNAELTKCASLLQNVKQIESEQGRTDVWSKAYREWIDLVDQLQAKLKTLRKEQVNSASSEIFKTSDLKKADIPYMTKVSNTIEHQMAEIQKMSNAKGWQSFEVKGVEEANGKIKALTLTVRDAEGALKQLSMQRAKLDTGKKTYDGLMQVGDVKILETSVKAQQKLNNEVAEYDRKINNAIKSLNGFANNATFKNNSANSSVQMQKQAIQSLIAEYEHLKIQLQGNISPTGLKEIETHLSVLKSQFDSIQAETNELKANLASVASLEKFGQGVKLLEHRIIALRNTNTKAEKQFGGDFDNLRGEADKLKATFGKGLVDNTGLINANRQLKLLEANIKSANKSGHTLFKTIGEQAKKFASWMSLTTIIAGLARSIRNMAREVIELDSAMTSLKKVTDETDAVYEKFLKNAAKRAKDLHAPMSDLVTQTAEWAKLGHSLSDSADLSKASMIYSNVGEIDNEQAVTNIVSAMKAFDIAVSDVMTIPDVYNKLGNEFAVSSKNLGVGMSQAATTMAMAGNDFNQVAALLTGAGEILGDNKLDEIGNGLKTVTLRIQNQAGALQELGEEYEDLVSVSKTQQQIYDLTGGAVNIMSETDPNTFRSTYDILKDIANVINTLNDTDASELIQLLFGKNRANVGTAVLKAFQSGRIDEAYIAAKESAGSAQKEFDKWSESLQAHINDFQAAFESFSQTVIDSDFLKGLIDSGTTFLEVLEFIVDKIGLLGTAMTTFGTIAAFKGKGFPAFISQINSANASVNGFIKTLSLGKNLKNIYKSFDIDLSGLNTNDINSLQSYIKLMNDGVKSSVAFDATMIDTSNIAVEQAKKFETLHTAFKNGQISAKDYSVATKSLSNAQKITTATSKALSTALNLVSNIGITLAISGLIKGIEYLATAEERATEKNEEFIERTRKSIEIYEEEEKFLSDIVDKYTELYITTEDLTSVKDDLAKMQDELVKKYGDEADALDLVNKKYSENIEAQRELRKAEAEKWLADNKADIRDAENILNGKTTNKVKLMGGFTNTEMKGMTPDEFGAFERLLKEYGGEIFGGNTNAAQTRTSFTGFSLSADTIDEQVKALTALAKAYSETGNYSTEFYNKIIKKRDELQSKINSASDTVTKAKYNKSIIDVDATEEYNRVFDKLIEKQREYNEVVTNNGTIAEKQNLQNEIVELGNAAWTAANGSKVLQDEISDVLRTTGTSIKASTDVLTNINDYMGEDFENSLSQIDKIKSAMQTLASGELLEWSDASELMFDIDTERVLGDFEEIDGKYRLIGNDISSLIKLKDKLIQKQIDEIEIQKQSQKEALKLAEANLATAKFRLDTANSKSDGEYYYSQVEKYKNEIKEINSLTRDYNYLIGYLNSQLGDTVDHATALKERMEKVQESADKYADAMTKQVDNIIDNLQDEQDILEEQKSTLEEQLDVLEEQKSELEDIIDKHKDIVDVIGEEVEREKKLLEEQRDAEEEAIQAKIDALKESKEKQEEENDLVEKELELQKKLADLEKAKQTKVRTFSQARGWHYDVDKEAVANAQTAVADAQKTYDDAVAEKVFSDQIEALEKQKETIGETYEEQLKAYENYYEEWKAILDEEINAENERIAIEIMGSDWREKIKKRDSSILNSFASSFRSYNNQLKNLVSNEIANLKESIIAKEDEIKAKQKQIKVWQDYKDQVEKSIDDIKNKYDDYVNYLNGVTLNENSTYEDRQNALNNFIENYRASIDEIKSIQNELEDVNASITLDTDISGASNRLADFLEMYRDGMLSMADIMRFDPENAQNAMLMYAHIQTGSDINEIIERLRGYSTGGVNDNTGIVKLHGEKQRVETVFNAQQGRYLYDMVKTGNFSNLVAQKAIEGLKGAKMSNLTNNNSNDRIINIQNMTIKADNPTQFHDQFMKEIGQYWRVQLAESKVK